MLPGIMQIYSQIAGHVGATAKGGSSSALAETYGAMCIFSFAFVLGFTVGSYLIGEQCAPGTGAGMGEELGKSRQCW